jgi:tRNA (cytidine/uridine-2'-O-)-methyltransferase
MLHIVLFRPEIPQNTGNIGRTCVALGAKLWLVEPLGFQMDEAKLKRAGMDYWDELQYQRVANWQTLKEQLQGRNMWLCTKFASRDHYAASYHDEDVLVFGSESSGVPDSIHEQLAEQSLRIPMIEGARSLNLATSVGIVAYEAYRQISLR